MVQYHKTPRGKRCWKGPVLFVFAALFLLSTLAATIRNSQSLRNLIHDDDGDATSDVVVVIAAVPDQTEATVHMNVTSRNETGISNDTVPLTTSSSTSVTPEDHEFEAGTRLPHPTTPISPILPRRHIAVFGLESSGTTFLTKLLASHAGVPFREGLSGGPIHTRRAPLLERVHSTEVLHVSQPWGAACGWTDVRGEIMPVLYPKECVFGMMNNAAFDGWVDKARLLDADEECIKVGAFRDYSNRSKILYYPKRFFVNITSHVKWYRDRGVDATAVIVSREKNIGHAARYHGHCSNETRVRDEERKGLALITEALENLPLLYETDNNSTVDASPPLLLVSYEQLVLFEDVYIHTILQQLGLQSKSRGRPPRVQDSNAVYVKTLQEIGEEKAASKSAKLRRMNDRQGTSAAPKKT